MGIRETGFFVDNEVARTCREDESHWSDNRRKQMLAFKIKDCAFEKCSGRAYENNGYNGNPCFDEEL